MYFFFCIERDRKTNENVHIYWPLVSAWDKNYGEDTSFPSSALATLFSSTSPFQLHFLFLADAFYHFVQMGFAICRLAFKTVCVHFAHYLLGWYFACKTLTQMSALAKLWHLN